MTVQSMLSLLQSIRPVEQTEPIPTRFVTTVVPQESWDEDGFQRSTGLVLPPDVRQFWREIRSARLFEDQSFGQWGLVLWSPREAVAETAAIRSRRPQDFSDGDLIVGEFLGDEDYLLVRIDPGAADFGSVVHATPIEKRDEWTIVASSLRGFLERWIESGGRTMDGRRYHGG